MNKPHKPGIEHRLSHAIAELPHPDFETIADTPVQQMTEPDYITRQPSAQRHIVRWVSGITAVCATLCLVLGISLFDRYGATDAVVDLDVNPGFEITANRNGDVLSMEAANDDAKELLAGLEYKNRSVEEVLDDLMDGLVDGGYLSQEKNAVLLSVWGRNDTRRQSLSAALGNEIARVLGNKGFAPDLAAQTLEEDEQIRKKAASYGISTGKMQLIATLCAQDASLNESQLAGMGVSDLFDLAKQRGLSLTGVTRTEPPESSNIPASSASGSQQQPAQSKDDGNQSVVAPQPSRTNNGDDDNDDDDQPIVAPQPSQSTADDDDGDGDGDENGDRDDDDGNKDDDDGDGNEGDD